jgi:superfamily II DNA or RNA helicase
MSYFSANYSRINYPFDQDQVYGLRNAQRGAIYAIASHFTLNEKIPAQIVMPTGSGKTAVLNLSAYQLRANRVLVISSSVLVRGQIFDEFNSLKTLKSLRVFHAELTTPRVKEIKSPIKSIEAWTELEEYDVVVGIPNSINEGINDQFRPPDDFFDLILVDEAHHVPAFTWTNVVKAFPGAKQIFFTATPFRRDEKEIDGRLAYYYPISKAYEDGIFGEIGYYPVIPGNVNPDLAIAKQAEIIFNRDKEAGFKHVLMVRTETKAEAEILKELYAKETALRLKKVDSSQSYGTIKKTIQKLKDGELDGIICVDMLQEGFDFPNLKIAALHSPKKSLANTLQFIGRFARTNAEHIGTAKFLAIPSDIKIGKQKLYEEGAIWNDIIKNLSDQAIEGEDELKSVLDTFETENEDPPQGDLSFYNLNPYCHVKIYKTDGINLEADFSVGGHETIYRAVSDEYNASFFITKEIEKPKWLLTEELLDIKHFFFLIFFDQENELLFIHSSIKTVQFYDDLVSIFAEGEYERIPKYQLNKVLLNISRPEFFNIGMQNRSANSGESYRIIAGQNAENTIQKSHRKNYANGHIFMKGISEGADVTVGYSSGSKVWSNAHEKIPNFIKWCKILASKITSNEVVKTNTGFDNLPIGIVVEAFPLAAHGAIWNNETFSEHPILHEILDDVALETCQLLDFEIKVISELSDLHQIAIDLTLHNIIILLTYDFQNHFQLRGEQEFVFIVETHAEQISINEYLNDAPLQIFLDDFATVSNHEYFAPPNEADFQYAAEKIHSTDWNALNTDITKEFYSNAVQKLANNNRNSLHETLQSLLIAENYDVLIYDHGSHEMADFVTLKEFADKIVVELFHVKGSTGSAPGDRVKDVYEVCMQALKSQCWTVNKNTFTSKIVSRTDEHEEKFVVGNLEHFKSIMVKNKRFEFGYVIVQPGISSETLSSKLSYLLAATNDTLMQGGAAAFDVMGS